MLRYLTILLVCQLVGETIVTGFVLPIPGPVLGMAILFLGLVVGRGSTPGLADFSRGLLQHLGLLFVPAGVGVVLHLQLLADAWLPIAGALLFGTGLTIVVTGWLMQRLARPPSARTPSMPTLDGESGR